MRAPGPSPSSDSTRFFVPSSASGECSDEPPAPVGVSTEESALVTVGGNATPGGVTDVEVGSSGACIHASSSGSPRGERRRPPAPPQPAEEDAELISDTEVEPGLLKCSLALCDLVDLISVCICAPQENIRAEHGGPQDEEPPTSVSQYFLSDIFTEVEDE